MIALVDYGIGNLRSVQKALECVGAEVTLTDNAEVILAAEKVVLPGVGAFGDGMRGLHARGLVDVIRRVVEAGTPLLGICVGMQVLFDVGEEMGEHVGLGLLPGRVKRFEFVTPPAAPFDCGAKERASAQDATPLQDLKIPHTGWNEIEAQVEHPVLAGLPRGAYAYFNHSYYCAAALEHTLALTDYGGHYPSIVGRGRLYGIQFHPEKSQHVGLLLLKNFVERG